MLLKKDEITCSKITNYTQFAEMVQTSQEDELQKKIKDNEAYIKYIKVHDKKAYEKYLSYLTYLECCV